eukprot:Hpha_TRINITY_DN16030_c2_g6::TRINITY_DN16030_c2_g6_i1::g.120872::m.120872
MEGLQGYDDEGNPLVEEELLVPEQPAGAGSRRKQRKRKKRAVAEEGGSDEDDKPGAAEFLPDPFGDVSQPVISGPPKELLEDMVEEKDEDHLPDDPRALHGRPKVESERDRLLASQRQENAKKFEQMEKAIKQAQREERKMKEKSRVNPMGHFSHPASDDRGIVHDGIHFWTNMGLGKMPLKIKKQWKMDDPRGCVTPDPKRARKNLWLPQE